MAIRGGFGAWLMVVGSRADFGQIRVIPTHAEFAHDKRPSPPRVRAQIPDELAIHHKSTQI